ncbi:hypothetical protein A6R68_18040 [Neotoma lepida]|uniref:Large ribosomal subunit protein eL36 n=1 Tax=Neotoma lepida TaxID=56216 RepID=A0A1A6HA95_NEOLE|nr:hypothetical protein A6R68_18040 [Neotoma lepida]
MALRYPMAVGLSKDHKVTKNVSKLRHSRCCGHLTKPTKFLQNMIWELLVCQELFKAKLALKFVRKRVGTHIFPKRKWEELTNVLSATRKAAAKKD